MLWARPMTTLVRRRGGRGAAASAAARARRVASGAAGSAMSRVPRARVLVPARALSQSTPAPLPHRAAAAPEENDGNEEEGGEEQQQQDENASLSEAQAASFARALLDASRSEGVVRVLGEEIRTDYERATRDDAQPLHRTFSRVVGLFQPVFARADEALGVPVTESNMRQLRDSYHAHVCSGAEAAGPHREAWVRAIELATGHEVGGDLPPLGLMLRLADEYCAELAAPEEAALLDARAAEAAALRDKVEAAFAVLEHSTIVQRRVLERHGLEGHRGWFVFVTAALVTPDPELFRRLRPAEDRLAAAFTLAGLDDPGVAGAAAA